MPTGWLRVAHFAIKKLHPSSLFLIIYLIFYSSNSDARVIYPVNKSYEDTVRIVVLWNTPLGRGCLGNPPPVGQETKDFVVKAIDTQYVKNVKVLKTYDAPPADLNSPAAGYQAPTITQIQALWPGKLPHVIVHTNAGWSGWNGPNLQSILDWAVKNYIGIVEIGDDGSGISTNVFGLGAVNGFPGELGTGQWLNQPNDSLLLKIVPNRDIALDSDNYPGLNGTILNAVKILGSNTFVFKPYASGGRCEADADEWSLQTGYENRVRFLGYQQGYNATVSSGDPNNAVTGYVGRADQWSTIVSIQDTTKDANGLTIRRGVALSFQPQYLSNENAALQLVYDAIMFSSLAHTLKPGIISVKKSSDTLKAGTSITLTAHIQGDTLPPEQLQSALSRVKWQLVSSSSKPGDSISGTSGGTIQIYGTEAHRQIKVVASYYDSSFSIWSYDTAYINVKPNDPYRLEINTVSKIAFQNQNLLMPKNHVDSVLFRNVIDTIKIASNETTGFVYPVLRDKYGNFIGSSLNASYQTLPSGNAATGSRNTTKTWEGIISRSGQGTAKIEVYEQGISIRDTIIVIVEATSQINLVRARTADVNGNGYLDRIVLTLDSIITFSSHTLSSSGFTVTHGSLPFSIDSITIRSGNQDSVIFIYLKESQNSELQTGFRPRLSFSSFDGVSVVTSYLCEDGAGPVIRKAYLMRPSLQGMSAPDTLHVIFSENVKYSNGNQGTSPSAVFNYYDSSILSSAAFNNIASMSKTSKDSGSIIMTNGFIITPLIDSLQFKINDLVLDTSDNKPNDNNKKAPILWGLKSDLVVTILNNPFIPGPQGTPLPPVVQNYYQKVISKSVNGSLSTPGIIIGVKAIQPVDKRPDESFGNVTIFDAVGNVVRNDIKVLEAKPYEYAFFWDGTNMNKRYVGGGTYLAIITIFFDGVKITHKKTIGIKIKKN